MNTGPRIPVQVADIGSEFADLDPSTDRYAARFQGQAGEWLLSRQTHALRQLMDGNEAANILCVGGGHAQDVRPLLEDGHSVTVHASCDEALGQAAKLHHPKLSLSVGPLRTLPFDDQSFDIVSSFRIMAHIGNWPDYLAALTRVARQAVIIDFPISGGFNRLEPLLFGLKKRIEGDTRKYTTISTASVIQNLSENGFTLSAQVGQFVLPMVLHRKLSNPSISAGLENACRGLGLARRMGTPIILRADRAQ